MRSGIRRAVRALGIVCVLTGAAVPAFAEPQVLLEGQAVQLGTKRYILHSDEIGRDFQVDITWPISPVPPGETLPAIYALDGGFGLMGASVEMLTGGSDMAPAFVVAVGYTGPLGPLTGPRNTDMLHRTYSDPRDGRTLGGGGQAFEDFLIDEVKPFIEARYPVDPDAAILAGHSGGGVFAAYVLANRPQAFAGYVIGGMQMQNPALPSMLAAAAPQGDGRKIFIFYTPNDLQGGARSDELAPALSGQDSTFVVREEVYDGRSHSGSYLMWAADALPFLLPPRAPRAPAWPEAAVVDGELLDSRAGVYEIHPGAAVAVHHANGRLYAQFNQTTPIELFAQSDAVFTAHALPAELEFSSGAALLRLTVRGVDMQAERTAAPLPAVAVFPDPERRAITVDPAALHAYVGEYATSDGVTITIAVDGGQLYGGLNGGPGIPLYAASQTEFFALDANAVLTFDAASSASASAVTFRLNNGPAIRAERR